MENFFQNGHHGAVQKVLEHLWRHGLPVQGTEARFQVGGKLFAAICKDGAGNDALLTLKLPPEENRFLREQYEDILPGYYCNKEHWSSIRLEGSVPDHLVRELMETSYRLVLAGLSKKKQREILGE